MNRSLRILVFAYVYPPDAGSGTFRTLYFTNHWAAAGDAVTVVTVDPSSFLADALVDEQLCERIAPAVTVVRAKARRPLQRLLELRNRFRGTSAEPEPSGADEQPIEVRSRSAFTQLKDGLTAMVGFPDAHNGWIPDALRQGARIVRAEKPDCIYASGGPWSGLVAATLLHRRTGIPLVIDFRDPWSSNPNLTKHGTMARAAHRRLEAFCVKRARRVITNTDELRRDFVARYEGAPAGKFVCITNGFEEARPTTRVRNEIFTLVHAGALYLSRNPKNFLKALAQLAQRGSIARDRFCVHFVGGLESADEETKVILDALTAIVRVTPRVSHEHALALQREATGLLLFQSGFPLQVPRKLYEYLSLELPILTVTEPDSATARILDDVSSTYTTADNVDEIARAVLKLYRDWQADKLKLADSSKLGSYSNRHLANKLRGELLASLR
jgi:glycosyltransferase involved in cell wall biosynthesis